MAGTFNGLTDAQWTIFEPLLPSPPLKPGKGRPHALYCTEISSTRYSGFSLRERGGLMLQGKRTWMGPNLATFR